MTTPLGNHGRRPACLIGVLIVLAVGASRAVAQQAGPPADDLAWTVFGRSSGLPTAPVLGLAIDNQRTVWIGTEVGPRQFDGRTWVTMGLPREAAGRTTRAVRQAPDGTRWVAQNARVLSSSDTGWRVHATTDSARIAPIYSMVVTTALGDTSVVVGTRGGVFRVRDGVPWDEVTIPGFSIASAIVATRETAGSAPELWIASLRAGVARLRDGAWTTWGLAAGLDSIVDHIALAPAGDSIEALAATPNGAFALYGDRWRPVGPRLQASRVLRVRVKDRHETWIGSLSGDVIRSVDGVHWDTLAIPERTRGSRVQVLEAVDHGLAVPSIYVGFRSGVLIRFRVGAAARLLAPRGLAGRQVVDVLARRDGDGLWMWAVGAGAVRYPYMALVLSPPAMLPLTAVRPRLVARSRDPMTELIAADGADVWRFRTRGWEHSLRLPASDTVRSLLWATAADGVPRAVLVTARGAQVEADDGAFQEWPGFPARPLVATVDSSSGIPELVVLDRDLTAWTWRGGEWLRRQAGSVPAIGNAYGASVVTYASGERALWVGTTSAIAVLRLEGGPPAWRLVDANEVQALRWYFVRDLRALGESRVGVGTSGGLLVLEGRSGFAGPVATLGLYSDADGLPHQNVNAVGAIDAAGRLWLGTETGAGFVDTEVMGRDRVAGDALRLAIRDAADTVVAPGDRVPWASRSLTVQVGFATGHREEDSRYRLELDGERVSASDWSESSTASLLALSPGRHEITAWAMDWRGVVAGPVSRTIIVLPPWYRTTIAWLAYAAVVIAAWWGIAEARLRRMRAETAAAVANERRLAGSEVRFRMLFEAGVTPELLVQRGRIVRANASALRLLADGNGGGLADRPVATVLPDGVPDERAGVSTGPREQRARTALGEVVPVEVRCTVIPLEADSVMHVQLRDLREERRLEAERRSLQEQLFESQRLEALGTLAGGVAHDFNNLLTVIQGNAELVVDHPAAPETPQSMQQILAATGRARDIVKQILTYSRRSRADFTPVPLPSVLDELHRMLRVTVPASVQVVVANRAADAVIHGDHTQLQQMLLNLATNAEHAMRTTGGGVLTIATDWVDVGEGDRRDVVIRVRDTGIGMAPEVMNRVFEPFFTTKPVGEGTGLGLSVLHGIVGAHGGTVRVESTPGEGTTFEVRLPAVAGISAGEAP